MIDRKKHVEDIIDTARFLRHKVYNMSLLKDSEITPSQWLVVGHIFRNEGSSTIETATALNMTGSAVTQLVNGLVTKGYVQREPSLTDWRAHRLILSEESKKRIIQFKEKRIQMMLNMFEVLTDQEFEQYVALNKKILESSKTN